MFAPKLKIKTSDAREVPVQQFLQNAFFNMWEQVVRAVGDLDGVIGFEVCSLSRYIRKHGTEASIS